MINNEKSRRNNGGELWEGRAVDGILKSSLEWPKENIGGGGQRREKRQLISGLDPKGGGGGVQGVRTPL